MAMGRVIKWGLGVIAALIVICIGVVAYVVSTIDFNEFKPEIEKAAMEATGRKLTMAGDIKVKISLSPALTVEDVSFANAEWGSRPNLASIQRLDVQVAIIPLLSSQVVVKKLILVDPDILVETNADGVSNLEFDTKEEIEKEAPAPAPQPEGKEPAGLPDVQVDKLVLENARLTYKDGQAGTSQVIVLSQVEAGMGKADGLWFKVEGAYNGQPIKLDGETGPIDAVMNANISWPLKIKAQAGGATVSLDGAIQDLMNAAGINLAFDVQGKNLTDLNALAGAALPDIGAYSLSGSLQDQSPQVFHLSGLNGKIGESDFNGAASLDVRGKKPSIKASLASKTLDLRPFLPEETEAPKAEPKKTKDKGTKKSDRVLPDDPLPTDAFHLVNAKADIRVDKLQLQGFALKDSTVDVTLKDGVLDVSTLKTTGGKGTLNMMLKAIAKGKDLDVNGKVTLDQLDLGGVLGFAGVTEAFIGNLDMDMEFNGKGASVRSLMAGLDGFVNMSINEGKLQNKYLNFLGGDLASGMMRMINPTANKPDYTKINCLISRVNIEDGLAETKVMVLDTEYMSVVAKGTVDFKTEQLNMSLEPLPKDGMLSGISSNLNFSLSELTQPFALGGTLAAPKLVLDRSKAIMTLGKGVGGTLLFGPAGAAAALMGGGQGDSNPCEAAMEAADKGVKYEGDKGEKGVADKAADSVVDSIKGVGKGLQNLFNQ